MYRQGDMRPGARLRASIKGVTCDGGVHGAGVAEAPHHGVTEETNQHYAGDAITLLPTHKNTYS